MNLEDLKKPFPPEAISWRVGSTNADKSKGMALAYIDARDVQDRLDAVCGVAGWQCRYIPMHDKKTVCEIGIRIYNNGSAEIGTIGELLSPRPFEWVWKADGAGDSDVEAEKGALSDAFKRAAVRWGIGRYLYDLDCPWVTLEPAGRSVKIVAVEYARLRQILAKDAPKPSATTSQATQGDAAGKSIPIDAPTPAQWLTSYIASVPIMTRDLLDDFTEKQAARLVRVKIIEPELHEKLMKAIQARQVELF